MDDFKIEQKVKEWRVLINLSSEYDLIIEKIVKRIVGSGCRLMPWTESKKSKHEWVTKYDYCIVWIKQICENRKELLWDMLHEFGHCLDENRITYEEMNELLKVQRREITAWILADQEFANIPELEKDKDEYEAYKWKCLKTYGISKV